MMAPARKFSILSMPSWRILEQSNIGGTNAGQPDWVVTLYFPGDGATTRFAAALRAAGFAVANAPNASSETPARAINRPTKTRKLKNADREVDFFFMRWSSVVGVAETPGPFDAVFFPRKSGSTLLFCRNAPKSVNIFLILGGALGPNGDVSLQNLATSEVGA